MKLLPLNVEVYFQDDRLWLTQKAMAKLFEKGRSTITEHLNHLFDDGELDKNVVCRDFRHTTQHGAIEGKTQNKQVRFYNLRAVTAVGYKVNSHRAIEFRKWARGWCGDCLHHGFHPWLRMFDPFRVIYCSR